MSERTAYVAALRREIASLVQEWQLEAQSSEPNLLVYQRDGVVVTTAGVGAARVALAVQAALRTGSVKELVSIGIAGACCPKHSVGSIVLPATVIDARTGERFATVSGEGVLVSVEQVASVQEKRRLLESYRADLVDMEAATVARLAAAHDLPFRAIKAVSDGSDFELFEDTAKFSTPDGQFREMAFAVYAAMRPRLWKSLLELARNSKLAINNLTAEIQADIKRNSKAE
jgi:adenosylhomocysteine nucleosidase